MSKTIGRFGYDIVKLKKSDKGLPFTPRLTIIVTSRSFESRAPIVSPVLESEGEIDEYIRDLKADLDAVGKKAKAAFTKAQAETKKIVAAGISN